jgi:hypothetical protein
VFDKFHIPKHLNEGGDKVRRQEHKRLLKTDDDSLKGTRQLWSTPNATCRNQSETSLTPSRPCSVLHPLPTAAEPSTPQCVVLHQKIQSARFTGQTILSFTPVQYSGRGPMLLGLNDSCESVQRNVVPEGRLVEIQLSHRGGKWLDYRTLQLPSLQENLPHLRSPNPTFSN